jgi:hypothetical protein
MVDQQPYMQYTGYCAHSRVRTWLCNQEHRTPVYDGTGVGTGDARFRTVEFDGSGFVLNLAPTWLALLNAVNPTIRSFGWSRASFDAMEAMKPSLTEMLLPNFVAELAESVPSIGRKAKRKFEQIERRRINDLRKRIKQSTRPKQLLKPRDVVPSAPIWSRTFDWFRKTANRVAWVNLAWQFAVKPTLADAKSIATIIDSIKSTLSELIRKGDQLQRRHYKRPCDIVDLPARAVLSTSQRNGNFWVRYARRFEWMQRPVYHASCLFSYDTKRLRASLGMVDAMIHSFGVTRMASVIWEAIPYSFVVDWFVSVGDLIESLEDSILDPLPIVIHDYNHSIKYEWKTILEAEMSVNSLSSFYATIDFAQRQSSVYERRRDVPSLFDSLSARTPSLNQAGLGLSLIILNMDGVHRGKFRKN